VKVLATKDEFVNMEMSRRKLLALGLGAPAAGLLGTLLQGSPALAALPVGASAFSALGPTRLADTRDGTGFTRLDANTIRVQVANRFGVPNNASAGVLNITVTKTRRGGYVTVYPAGSVRPDASNVNVEYVNQTIPNLATVQLGVGGAVDIFAEALADIVVDLNGAYVPVSAAVSVGRFVALPAAVRVLDTRDRNYKVGALQTERVNCALAVPAGAAAMVLNLTVFDSTGPGHWTAFPMGTPMPTSSNLNADGVGQTRANQAILPVGVIGAQRGFDIFSAAGGHFIVDVAGYFTGPSSPSSTDGLFVPNAPDRRLDTRRAGSYGRMYPGWTAEFDYVGRSSSQGVVFNLTTTQTRGAGHFTAYAARTTRPNASNLNASYVNQTIANHAIVTTSGVGVAVFTAGGGHLIADVAGYFTGLPIGATTGPEPNIVPAPPVGPALPYVLRSPIAGITSTVVEGVADAIVNAGYTGHWPGTGLAGEPNHMVLFAHRTEHGGTFRNIHLIGPGDIFTLTAADGRVFRYLFASRVLTSPLPADIFAAASSVAAPSLSLVACSRTDFTPTNVNYRIVVTGTLIPD
jgi:hypothetical protein